MGKGDFAADGQALDQTSRQRVIETRFSADAIGLGSDVLRDGYVPSRKGVAIGCDVIWYPSDATGITLAGLTFGPIRTTTPNDFSAFPRARRRDVSQGRIILLAVLTHGRTQDQESITQHC